MKKLFFNAINSLFSTVAGGNILLEGVHTHNIPQMVTGVFVILLGAITNEQGSSKPFE